MFNIQFTFLGHRFNRVSPPRWQRGGGGKGIRKATNMEELGLQGRPMRLTVGYLDSKFFNSNDSIQVPQHHTDRNIRMYILTHSSMSNDFHVLFLQKLRSFIPAFPGAARSAILGSSFKELKVAFTNVFTEVPGSPIFLMKMVSKARHLEIQIVGDEYGNTLALNGRDCSTQRTWQIGSERT